MATDVTLRLLHPPLALPKSAEALCLEECVDASNRVPNPLTWTGKLHWKNMHLLFMDLFGPDQSQQVTQK